jgi:tetratricopeptide (TPR) repeat protein
MTRKLKIAVYAISKNEEQFVNRFCDSAKDADLVLIADTGSTDGTVARAIENGAVVHEICVSPWRFDKARDTALSLIPRDIDVCISLDLDEVLMDGWRAEIERVWQENTTRLRYQFDWGCGISFMYEKIHHRNGYHWHHPVHEYPRPDGRITEVYAQTDMLLVKHLPDNTKSRGQYMPLLELAVKEDPYCPRNAFYHARELTFYARWHEAIAALNRYLELPGATWITERGYAMRLLGKSYENIGDFNQAYKWYQLACIECPTSREPWIDLSVYSYIRSDWETSYYSAKKALNIKNKELVYTMDPTAWGEKPYMYASIAAWNLGKHDEARQLNEEALKFAPNDQLLLSNKEAMKGNDDANQRDGSTSEQPRSTMRTALRPNQRTFETVRANTN